MPTHPSKTAQYILDMAQKHKVTYTPGPNDALAMKITELSGDEVNPDEIELLAIALQRAGILNRREMVMLIAQYLREIRSA